MKENGINMETTVAVVGAGPVGATLACLLATSGVATAVIDRMPLPPMEHPDFDGRAYAIAAASRKTLEAAGVWPLLPEKPGPITGIRISDGQVDKPASPLFLHFDLADAGLPPSECLSAFGWMVEAQSLRRALNAHLHAQPNLAVFAPAEAKVHRSHRHAVITIEGGPRIFCRLVVAADGRESQLRAEARIPVTRIDYGQTALVGSVAHERPHHNTAVEHFLPSGPFAQLPMSPIPGVPHLSAIVWTERQANAERLMQLNDSLYAREMMRRLGSHLGRLRPIGRRWSYRLSALFAHRYFAPRLALIGDAAHGIHPIAGQGLNLGFRDVAALAELIIDAVQGGRDPGAPSLLQQYQRRRRADNMLMLGVTDALDRLFSNDHTLLRLIRDLGLAGVHRIPALKRLFVRQAMGLATGLL
ncbi:MAG: UbiH/UbiF/VisC/COQ6 family ubiquinone biosynthesis hydroxylase [Acidobacteriia bacterium]|nr:UbiH/UbiF/VisC/COQ6 family ubiquinone biosynthesis hydroxylase [Methyloceanibacter sp.]MCL6490938.1 UbiH/UbiF/VisC/COQ6 family ubiquinone biosynthesis hydroxylase [Terriglobia bacterium]